MAILFRLAGFVALWLFSRRRGKEPSAISERISKLSWPAKANLSWRLVRDKRVSRIARLTTFLPVLYILSPIDLVPDFIPVLGRLDDALVFGLVVDVLIRSVPVSVLVEHLDRIAPSA